MKLYVFETINFGKPKFTMEEYDVEEKNKTYVCEAARRRFNKSDVETVSGYYNNQCILLENNPDKAAKILLKQKEQEIKKLNEELDRKLAEIESLKRYIKA